MARDTRRQRTLVGMLLGAGLWALLAIGAPTGASALGELTQLGVPSRACIWDGSLGECASGLVSGDLTTGVAVSPDSKFTYVVSAGSALSSGTLAILARNTTDGGLRQIRCMNENGTDGCRSTPGLNAARSVTVSPDGKSVYVAASTLVSFARDTKTGLLTFRGCLDDDNTACGDNAMLSDVAVSPDNKSIFTVTPFGELSIYKRNTTTSDPTFTGCYFAGSNSIGCDSVGQGLEEASGVAVSPDNKSVYVSGTRLTTFTRNPNTLAVSLPAVLAQEAPCLSSIHPDCPPGDVNGFAAASRVVVSKDNKSVYATWSTDGMVRHFRRNTTTGALTAATCVAYNGAPDECIVVPGLRGAYGIAVSKDNKSVYVAGRDDDAIVDLARNTTTGVLSEKDCVARENPGCTDAAQTFDPFGVAVSPDGRSVYATSPAHQAVAEFRRTTSGAATGHLTQQDRPATGCITAYQDLRLICTPVTTLEAPIGVVVSKDGKSAYVGRGSINGGGLELFRRNTTTGVLTDRGCLRAVADAACGAGGALLQYGYRAAISADNKTVYVTAGDHGIAILRRNTTTGVLSDGGCIARTAVDGCTVDPDLASADHLVVSADSKSVYVTSFVGGVYSFKRNTTTGALTPNGCLRGPFSSVNSCTASSTVDFAGNLAITADGKSVYVLMDHLVREYDRNTTTGVLSHAGCIGPASGGCVPARTLQDPEAIAVSNDNRSVYVSNGGFTPGTSQGIAILTRNTSTRVLTQAAGPAGCIEQDRTNDCTADNVYFVPELAVSPDNKSLYVDQRFGALAIYARSTQSATFGQITKLPGAAGCVDSLHTDCTEVIGLDYMGGLAISADNKNVYTTSFLSGRGVVDVFSRKLTATPPPAPTT